ncbi:MAG: hypothetical protein IV085_14020 [Thiobacillus sp.]|nr:hypothetical protein [Thiobacillus sp.]
MIELEPGKSLDINLKEDQQGRDRVIVTLKSEGCELQLTPHQARVLATELIMAVNRAEVRSNLKHSHNMVRSTQQSATQKKDVFTQGFAKFI